MVAYMLPSCTDTHDDLPYVEPNIQHQQDKEQEQNQPQDTEDGAFLNEPFSTSLGKCTVSSNSDVQYVIDHSTAKISGYENDKYIATEAYLLTPTFDMSAAGTAYYSFEHIIAYEKGDATENEQFVVSTDYSGDVAKATWTVLPITSAPSSGKPDDWNDFTKASFNIPADYMKNNVTFAFRYRCNDKAASTWEIRNFVIKTGTTTETAKYEKPSAKESSLENPLTVSEAIASPTSDNTMSYVKGIVVGFIDGQKYSDGAKFTADGCQVETNLLIAESADEKDANKCIPVQLPASSKHRTALNLKDNKEVLGKEVVLGGYIQAYFGVNGLKSLFYSALNGVVIDAPVANTGFDGDDNTAEKLTELNVDLAKGIDKFSIYNFSKTNEVAHVWNQDAQYGMKATASINKTNYESKAWLISPSVDLSAYDKIEFYFDHAANYFGDGGASSACAIYVSKDYQSGEPDKATWTKIDVAKWATDWTFVDNTIDLTEFKGDNVHIAFEYTSTADNAGTFEVRNVYLGQSREAENPVFGFDGESQVKNADVPFEHNFATTVNFGDFVVYDVKKFASKDEHVWTAGKYGATAVATAESESWMISPNFALANDKKYELTFTNWYKNAANPANVFKAYISPDYNGDFNTATWTPIEMTFGNASVNNDITIDLSNYAGYIVTIGFQYTSIADEKGTFEIIKFALKEKSPVDETPVSGFDGASDVQKATLPYSFDFKTKASVGDFIVYDVKKFASKDEHIWTASKYGATAVATAESESWFISPEFTLESGKEYELKYTNWYKNAANPADVYKAYISENFTGDFASASWTPIEMTFGAPSKNNEATLDLSNYAGKSFVIGFQYTSTTKEKGTFEVINIALKEKTSSSADLDGKGTKANPFSYAEYIASTSTEEVYVKVFIVGSYVNSAFNADASAAVNSNIAVAASASETNTDNIIPVALDNKTNFRTQLNIKDNPTMQGKEVILCGKKVKYFGNDNGLKNLTWAFVDGVEIVK